MGGVDAHMHVKHEGFMVKVFSVELQLGRTVKSLRKLSGCHHVFVARGEVHLELSLNSWGSHSAILTIVSLSLIILFLTESTQSVP